MFESDVIPDSGKCYNSLVSAGDEFESDAISHGGISGAGAQAACGPLLRRRSSFFSGAAML